MSSGYFIPSSAAPRTPLGVRLLAALCAVTLLLAGPVLVPRVVTMDYGVSIAFAALWLTAGTVVLGRTTRSRSDLRRTVRAASLLTCGVFVAVFAWSTLHTTTVHDKLVTGRSVRGGRAGAGGNVQLAGGKVTGLDVSASGTAAVVQLAGGGKRLTLARFSVENGPDLRVYLASGDGEHLGSYKDIGGLKGTKGDQQYVIPAAIDPKKYSTVVIYCRAFAVAFAQAKLRPG